jgi:hypothetical protein
MKRMRRLLLLVPVVLLMVTPLPAIAQKAESKKNQKQTQKQPPKQAPKAPQPKEWTATQAHAQIKKSLVQVQTNLGTGTGFVYLRGNLIATCYHVIEGAADLTVTDGSSAWRATNIYADKVNDIALLELTESTKKPALKPKTTIAAGQKIFVVGHRLGYLTNSITEGIISAARSLNGRSVLQITADISPGSSGSPVVDTAGNLVGVATSALVEDESVKLATPASAFVGLESGPTIKYSAYVTENSAALLGPIAAIYAEIIVADLRFQRTWGKTPPVAIVDGLNASIGRLVEAALPSLSVYVGKDKQIEFLEGIKAYVEIVNECIPLLVKLEEAKLVYEQAPDKQARIRTIGEVNRLTDEAVNQMQRLGVALDGLITFYRKHPRAGLGERLPAPVFYLLEGPVIDGMGSALRPDTAFPRTCLVASDWMTAENWRKAMKVHRDKAIAGEDSTFESAARPFIQIPAGYTIFAVRQPQAVGWTSVKDWRDVSYALREASIAGYQKVEVLAGYQESGAKIVEVPLRR